MTLVGGGGQLVLSQINTTLSNFIPAVLALVIVMLLGRMKLYNTDWKIEESSIMDRTERSDKAEGEIPDMTLFQAFLPYLLLSAMTIAVLFFLNDNLLGLSSMVLRAACSGANNSL